MFAQRQAHRVTARDRQSHERWGIPLYDAAQLIGVEEKVEGEAGGAHDEE